MEIHRIYAENEYKNYFHLILLSNGDAYCVDPYCAELTMSEVSKEKSTLKGLINTHAHWDHTKGNSELLENNEDLTLWVPFDSGIDRADKEMVSGEVVLRDGGDVLLAVSTPGHMLHHTCLLLVKDGKQTAFISGDTVFNAGVGNCKDGGEVDKLFESIQNLKDLLQDDVLIYPSHNYIKNNLGFTLSLDPTNSKALELLEETKDKEHFLLDFKTEKKINLFFNLENNDIYSALDLEKGSEIEVFRKLRSLRDEW